MPLTLNRYINRPVFVSIPSLFEDGVARPYTLLGAEAQGLWLQADLLTDRLLGKEGRELAALSPAVFVPFAQVAGVLVATTMPDAPPEAKPQTPAKPRAQRNAASKR